MLDGVERALPPLGRAQRLPRAIGDRHPQQRQQGGQRAAKVFVQREQLAGDLLLHRAWLVVMVDPEIRA